MTLHAAKGLEFPVVFIVALEEGLLPHTRANTDEGELEEERRLLFVGITRARRELYLSRCRVRTFRGQQQATVPSRFLQELPEGPIEYHDRSGVESGYGRDARGPGNWPRRPRPESPSGAAASPFRLTTAAQLAGDGQPAGTAPADTRRHGRRRHGGPPPVRDRPDRLGGGGGPEAEGDRRVRRGAAQDLRPGHVPAPPDRQARRRAGLRPDRHPFRPGGPRDAPEAIPQRFQGDVR
ncbi:MAG: 3'-5' exonuclease [Isosphaeraceae bacterium]